MEQKAGKTGPSFSSLQTCSPTRRLGPQPGSQDEVHRGRVAFWGCEETCTRFVTPAG